MRRAWIPTLLFLAAALAGIAEGSAAVPAEPAWAWLIPPLLTVAGVAATVLMGLGAVRYMLGQFSREISKLWEEKVSKEACGREHHQLEQRLNRVEEDVREARG